MYISSSESYVCVRNSCYVQICTIRYWKCSYNVYIRLSFVQLPRQLWLTNTIVTFDTPFVNTLKIHFVCTFKCTYKVHFQRIYKRRIKWTYYVQYIHFSNYAIVHVMYIVVHVHVRCTFIVYIVHINLVRQLDVEPKTTTIYLTRRFT